jgi:hypothetical protein
MMIIKCLYLFKGDISGDKAVCHGDSGGGLYVEENINGKSKYVLAGISSFVSGLGCNYIDRPK